MRKIFEVWAQISKSKRYTIDIVDHLRQLIEWEFDEPYEDYITLISEQIARAELLGTAQNPDGTSGGKYIFYLMEIQCLGNSLYYILKATKYYCKSQNKECSTLYSIHVEPQDYKHLTQIFKILRKLDDFNDKALDKALKTLPQDTQDKIWDDFLENVQSGIMNNLRL
ncbi:hypothetical protein [Thermococcus sp. 21S7]|uniref:hypothetical protein n=1 Tax=Thermococcus sp. 21S7 TaxID=1638221 RepID=UPI001439A046|nr:hypothetical protein [Thermococcus sp. 21S7]NJE60458.1 hypothetical protein [Thermococcus sp. 21S7]